MIMQRVLCHATVDLRDDGKFSVDVVGKKPHDQTRNYVIDAPSEKDAAMSCMDRFVAEMQKLDAEGTDQCQ